MEYSKIKRDLYFGIFSMAFSIFYGISTILTVKVLGDSLDSGRIFPYIISGIMFCLSVILVTNCIKNIQKIPPQQRIYFHLMHKPQILRLIAYLTAISIYIIGLIYVGYIVSTLLYLVFLLLFMNSKSKLAIALISIITPIVLWFVFTIVLEVQFPESLLI